MYDMKTSISLNQYVHSNQQKNVFIYPKKADHAGVDQKVHSSNCFSNWNEKPWKWPIQPPGRPQMGWPAARPLRACPHQADLISLGMAMLPIIISNLCKVEAMKLMNRQNTNSLQTKYQIAQWVCPFEKPGKNECFLTGWWYRKIRKNQSNF